MFCLLRVCALKASYNDKFAYGLNLMAALVVLGSHVFRSSVNNLADLLLC